MWHSACSSGDGEVYLFGGSSISVFVQEETSLHGKQMLIFRCGVPSLSRICADFIIDHVLLFEQSIPDLPIGLRRQIEARFT
jgi:hypothetical protein